MTRSKHESTATSKLVNLTTKRDSVFMAFSVGVVIVPTPFWRENAVFAYPSWLRLCRVRYFLLVSHQEDTPTSRVPSSVFARHDRRPRRCCAARRRVESCCSSDPTVGVF